MNFAEMTIQGNSMSHTQYTNTVTKTLECTSLALFLSNAQLETRKVGF